MIGKHLACVVVSLTLCLAGAFVSVLAAAAVIGTGRLEGDAPLIAAPESLIVGAAGSELRIELADSGTGLRSFSIRLLHQSGSRSVASQPSIGDDADDFGNILYDTGTAPALSTRR